MIWYIVESQFCTHHFPIFAHRAIFSPWVTLRLHDSIRRSSLLRTLPSTVEIRYWLSSEKRTVLHCWQPQYWRAVTHYNCYCRRRFIRIGNWQTMLDHVSTDRLLLCSLIWSTNLSSLAESVLHVMAHNIMILYVCMYICIDVCMYVHACVCMYVCMHVCMCVCMGVCMYVRRYACTVYVRMFRYLQFTTQTVMMPSVLPCCGPVGLRLTFDIDITDHLKYVLFVVK